MTHIVDPLMMEQAARWARTGAENDNMVRSPACKINPLARKSLKPPCLMKSQLKSPKCYIKITGSRYNGTFLLNIDNALDDAIFHTMRDIEVALEEQADPTGKRVSPKNCLSSVFRCFGTSELQNKGVCSGKRRKKPNKKHAQCSLTATINKSDLGPLFSAVQSNSVNPPLENTNESVVRDFVDVFRTTLDQFHDWDLSEAAPPKPFVVPANGLTNFRKPPSSKLSNTEIYEPKQSNEELQKVSFIKFSQDQVLVIQPPKPSNNDSKELEVGIEVKPKTKTTSSNVGQSIKLAKDKVLIGLQDGRGVLQINEERPKRSLHMVIEEGVSGKPSMKFSMKEETRDEAIPEESQIDGRRHFEIKQESPKNCNDIKHDWNESLSTTMNNDGCKHGVSCFNVRNYKSVESQVSWDKLKDASIHPRGKMLKTESTQYQDPSDSVLYINKNRCVCCSGGTKPNTSKDVGNQVSAEASQVTEINSSFPRDDPDLRKPTDSRINRMPYLVHTLYEPRSLQNSSAYFTSNRVSTHHDLIGRAPVSRKIEKSKRQIKKPKSFSISSDHSSSSKCTKIFRDIGEIKEKPSRPFGKKDASKAATMVEDFEQILQSMCGSSYLYHHPEHRDLLETKPNEHTLDPLKRRSERIYFDQWTQTDSCNQGFTTEWEPATRTLKVRDSGDGSRSKMFQKKKKHTEITESSTSVSGLDDGLSSESSESNKNKLVFSMFASSDEMNSLARTSSRLMSANRITGKAKSTIGQKIFDAIENPSKMFHAIKKTNSFVYPACKDASKNVLQEKPNLSVAVNMALYAGPTGHPSITGEELKGMKNMDVPSCYDDVIKPVESKQEQAHNASQLVTSSRLSFPIRIKSKSCQNLSGTPWGSRAIETVDSGNRTKSQIRKLRYPQITATDRHHTSALNVCGILNLNEGGKNSDCLQPLANFENLCPRLDRALPSAIRSLLLPRQQSPMFNEHNPTFFSDDLGSANDYWDLESISHIEDNWYGSNNGFASVKTVAIHSGLIKRTFFAMKSVRTVVTRKLSKLFRKMSPTDSDKRKTNLSERNSVAYVAIPLRKKSENLHLCPRIQ